MPKEVVSSQAPKKKRRKWPIVLAVVAVIVILFIILDNGEIVDDGASYSKDTLLSEEETSKMFSNTADYIGQSVNLYGQIFNEASSDDSGTFFQMFCDPENGDKNVMIYVEGGYKVKTDNIVLVKGVVTDTYTGDNAFGAEITGPIVSAKSVEDASYADAFAPALKTVDSGAKLEVAKIQIVVDKVEFAESETRLFVTVNNESSGNTDISTYSASITQGGKQYDYQENYDAKYELLPDSIKPGVSASGVLVFPSIEQSDFKFIFDVNTGDDWYDGQEISVSAK